jgi:DNA-binding GntR family transcriptional regulator
MADLGRSTRSPSADPDGDLPDLPAIAAPRKLAADAAEILREQILSGNLRNGTHLVEAKLASRLGVSRGTIREALKMLSAEGLVDEAPRRGAFVVLLDRQDVREIYDLRAAIEGRAAYLLTARRDEDALDGLTSALEALKDGAAAGDRPAIRRLDLAFHEEVCRGSGNDRLLDVFHRYVPALHTLLAYDDLVYASLDAIVEQHQAIYDAIRSGEPDAAAAAVAAHCDVARDQVSAHFESTPEPSS